MTRYSTNTLLEAWKCGKTLSEALALFVPQSDKARLARSNSQIRSTSAIGKRNFSAIGIEADALIDVLQQAQMQLASATDTHLSRERQLLVALENGQLVAIGYATAKGVAARPELVPPFLFQRQFAKFRKSEFRDGDHRFAKVRIVAASALVKSKIGRPSIRDQVFEIAVAIEGQIRHLRPGEQAAEVHRHGSTKFPQTFKDKSPTLRAIDRHLKSYWEFN